MIPRRSNLQFMESWEMSSKRILLIDHLSDGFRDDDDQTIVANIASFSHFDASNRSKSRLD